MKRAEIHGMIVYENGSVFYLDANGNERPKRHSNGEYYVVSHNGKRYVLHRLIAEAFIPNPDLKPYVNHIDGNTHNNSADNLEWVTPGENVKHAWKVGLIPRRHLTERRRKNWNRCRMKSRKNRIKEVRRIKGITQKKLAQAIHLSRQYVCDLENGYHYASFETLYKIASVLECNVSDLIEDEDKKAVEAMYDRLGQCQVMYGEAGGQHEHQGTIGSDCGRAGNRQ